MIRFIKRFILKLINPGMWCREFSTNKYVDEFFRNPKPEDFNFEKGSSGYTTIFKGVEVWIANKYFCSPYIRGPLKIEALPYADTTVDFFNTYYKALINHTLTLQKGK